MGNSPQDRIATEEGRVKHISIGWAYVVSIFLGLLGAYLDLRTPDSTALGTTLIFSLTCGASLLISAVVIGVYNASHVWEVAAEGVFDRVEFISRGWNVPDTVIRFQDGRYVVVDDYHQTFPYPRGTLIRVETNGLDDSRITQVNGPENQ